MGGEEEKVERKRETIEYPERILPKQYIIFLSLTRRCLNMFIEETWDFKTIYHRYIPYIMCK